MYINLSAGLGRATKIIHLFYSVCNKINYAVKGILWIEQGRYHERNILYFVMTSYTILSTFFLEQRDRNWNCGFPQGLFSNLRWMPISTDGLDVTYSNEDRRFTVSKLFELVDFLRHISPEHKSFGRDFRLWIPGLKNLMFVKGLQARKKSPPWRI